MTDNEDVESVFRVFVDVIGGETLAFTFRKGADANSFASEASRIDLCTVVSHHEYETSTCERALSILRTEVDLLLDGQYAAYNRAPESTQERTATTSEKVRIKALENAAKAAKRRGFPVWGDTVLEMKLAPEQTGKES